MPGSFVADLNLPTLVLPAFVGVRAAFESDFLLLSTYRATQIITLGPILSLEVYSLAGSCTFVGWYLVLCLPRRAGLGCSVTVQSH